MVKISRTNTIYLLKEYALFLGFSYLLLLNGTNNRLVDIDILRVSAVLLTGVGIAWILAGNHSGRSMPLGLPLLAWTLVYLGGVAASIDPRRSFDQMLLMSASIFIFALIADLVRRGWPAELVIKSLLLASVVIVFIGWAEVVVWYLRWLQSAPGEWIPKVVYRPPSANVIAVFMNMVILLSLARSLFAKTWPGRIAPGLLALAACGLEFFTSSRAGWLSAAVGLSFLGVVAYQNRPAASLVSIFARLRRRPFLTGILLLGGVLFIGAVGWLLYRQALHPSHGPILSAREEYWPPAMQVFRRLPLLGSGPFTYASAFLSANSVPPKVLYVHAQGSFFNLLAERGILGALAMGWLVVAIVRSLWQRLQSSQAEKKAVVVGASAALLAFGVHSFFDGFHTEPIGLWALVIALAAAMSQPHGLTSTFVSTWRRPYWVLFIIASVWIDLWLISPLYQGVKLANTNQWQMAALSFEQSVQRDPSSTIAYQQLGLAGSILASKGQATELAPAAEALEKTIQLEPSWAINYANLGALYAALGDLPGAYKNLQESTRRAPACALCYLNLGVVAEKSGDRAAAESAYTQALHYQPEWQEAYFWRSTAFRQDFYKAWRVSHPAAEDLTEEDLQARLASNSLDMTTYVELAEAYLAEGRLDDASHLLDQAGQAYASGSIDSVELVWARASLAAARADLATAVGLGQQALDAYQMQGIGGPNTFGQLYYAPLMFRRPAMAVELVPQLVTIPLPDRWGQRMLQLGRWYETLGEKAKADATYQELQQAIPDFELPD
jgi:tetratricopeptide (TPR) repeat protein/O-antigen ligase